MSNKPVAEHYPPVPRPIYSTADPNRTRITSDPTGESKTKQSFKKEADINNIVETFNRTGIITHQATHGGSYGEFAAFDYQEAIHMAREAENVFNDLPAHLRDHFNHDPDAFFGWITKASASELAELGFTEPQNTSAPSSDGPTEPA